MGKALLLESGFVSNLATLVSSKVEEGDKRGAVRIAVSDDITMPFNEFNSYRSVLVASPSFASLQLTVSA
jgi:hypothetical protein